MTSGPQQFTFTIAVLFTLNYIMGTGFLTIPWAFNQSGILLGVIVLGIIIIPSIIGALFILESMARAEALSLNSLSRTIPRKGYNSISTHDSEDGYPQFQTTNWIVGTRKYEMTELCEIFLGTTGMHCFSFILAVYLYGSLWAYGTVFANSLTANFPLGEYSYYIYLIFFAFIVIPTSCLELSEQIILQMIYSACRVLMIIFMISTVVVAYYRTESTYIDTSLSPEQQLSSSSSSSSLCNWEGLHIILPIALFANIFHHSIPSLSEPVIEKKSLHYIYIVTLICCYIAYTLIGVVLALYFGNSILSSSNLNWMDYDGAITFQEISSNYRILLVQIISSFIIVFPAVDVASAFPLCAITLGNNLFTSLSPENRLISTYDRHKVIFYRLVASIPPIFGAMFVKDLGTITDYTGITGFILVFIFPSLLAYYSKQILIEKHIDPHTQYSSMFTNDLSLWGLFFFGVFVTLFVIGSLIYYGSP